MEGKVIAPGPGKYDIPDRAIEGSKSVMGLKLDKHSVLEPNKTSKIVPGPG